VDVAMQAYDIGVCEVESSCKAETGGAGSNIQLMRVAAQAAHESQLCLVWFASNVATCKKHLTCIH
jgi:hypothetical protein